MTNLNPYDPPGPRSEIEQNAPPTLPRHGFCAYIGWALLAGAGVGGCIGIARFFVEGFYVWDAVRDLLVGTAVGIIGGTVWFIVHCSVTWIRHFHACSRSS
jgi:hypothetical protein